MKKYHKVLLTVLLILMMAFHVAVFGYFTGTLIELIKGGSEIRPYLPIILFIQVFFLILEIEGLSKIWKKEIDKRIRKFLKLDEEVSIHD